MIEEKIKDILVEQEKQLEVDAMLQVIEDDNLEPTEASIKNAKNQLISEKKDILRVPISAIQKDDDGYYVTMEANYDKKYVQVGENDSEYIEVTEGLFENDRVITESLLSYDE